MLYQMPRSKAVTGKKTKPVEVPDYAHAGVQEVAVRTDMSQKAIVGKVLGWFAKQDAHIQGVIIGEVPDALRPDFARLILEKMASGSTEDADAERGREAVRRARSRQAQPRRKKSGTG